MGYQYRGNNKDAGTAVKRGPKAGRAPFDPQKCGTYAGYKQHQRHGQKACQGCKEANAANRRNWYHANKQPVVERAQGVYMPGVCGTHAGYARHRRNNTIPCAECRAGHAEYTAQYRTRRVA